MNHKRRPRRYTEDSYLPASVLARLGRCETLVSLEMREGETTTVGGQKARAVGIAEHDRFHQAVTKSHNRPDPTGRRSPCFIASAVYGVHDARTDELRDFRDAVLLRSFCLAWVVWVYYAISPAFAAWLATRPRAAACVAKILDAILARVVRPMMEE